VVFVFLSKSDKIQQKIYLALGFSLLGNFSIASISLIVIDLLKVLIPLIQLWGEENYVVLINSE
jgi:hypothetical protein